MAEVSKLAAIIDGLVQNTNLQASDLDVGSLWVGGTAAPGSSNGATQLTQALVQLLSGATSADTVSTLVTRDASGNFSAGTITANLTGNASGTAANITATTNSTLTTLSALSLPGAQVTGNIAGNAANITATTNSTLTTLSALTTANSLALTGDVTGTAGATVLSATTNSTLVTLSALSLPYSQVTGGPTAGANTALSNLAAVAINTSLLPGTTNSINLGSSTKTWSDLYTEQGFFGAQSVSAALVGGSATLPSGDNVYGSFTAFEYITSTANIPIGFYTQNNTSSDAIQTGNVYLETGNKTAGTGNSGDVVVQTGTSAGGNRGKFIVNALSLELPSHASDPASPVAGDQYYNTSDNTIHYYNGTAWESVGSGSGTVTSVTFTGDGTVFSSTPSSAVTTSGTVTATLNTQSANTVLAGPVSGAAADPTFRALVAADIPSLSATYVTQSEVGAASGVASLDGGGKIPLSQLPSTLMEFQGNWDPTTNTPTLVDGTGTTGFTYWVSAADTGTVAGLTDPSMYNFQIGDLVIYNGTKWVLVTPAAGVQSVNGAQGAVVVNAINQLTGDVTTAAASGSQSEAATIASIQGTTVSGTTGTGNVVFSASPTFTGTITAPAATFSSTLSAPSLSQTMVAGQSFTANTSYLVRMGQSTDGGTYQNRVYAADPSSAAANLNFWVIGIASSAAGTSAGGNISVTMLGSYTLASADTGFSSGTNGQAVWLSTSGALTLTAPSTSGYATVKVGTVQTTGSGTASSVLVNGIQLTGIN